MTQAKSLLTKKVRKIGGGDVVYARYTQGLYPDCVKLRDNWDDPMYLANGHYTLLQHGPKP